MIATSSFTPPHTTTIPLLHSITTISNKTQYPTRTDHLPDLRRTSTKSATTLHIRSLRPHSPRDTLSRFPLHTPNQQQATKCNSRCVRTSSLIIDFEQETSMSTAVEIIISINDSEGIHPLSDNTTFKLNAKNVKLTRPSKYQQHDMPLQKMLIMPVPAAPPPGESDVSKSQLIVHYFQLPRQQLNQLQNVIYSLTFVSTPPSFFLLLSFSSVNDVETACTIVNSQRCLKDWSGGGGGGALLTKGLRIINLCFDKQVAESSKMMKSTYKM